MRMSYHELVGKRVFTADGQAIGRIADLVAERQGERLCVTRLLVGRTGLARRIGFGRSTLIHLATPWDVPWSLVVQIGRHVQLAVDRADLAEACAAPRPQTNKAPDRVERPA